MSNTAEAKTEREQDFDTVMRMSSSPDMRNCLGYGLIVMEGAAIALAQAAGFIRGLVLSDEGQAMDAAHDLMKQLRYLKDYGGCAREEGRSSMVPAYRVAMGHDCTFLGFSLLWLRAVRPTDEEQDDPDLVRDKLYGYESASGVTCVSDRVPWSEAYETWVYKPAWNGGLLYRGPAAGEVYSVALDSPRFWSIHT